MNGQKTNKLVNRLTALDGLRGIAIIVVVLSHAWILDWPLDLFDDTTGRHSFFRTGNAAVTLFLVASGFLTYRALAKSGLENMTPAVTLVRRIIRVSPTLWLMLLVLLVVAATDPTDTTSPDANRLDVLHAITYTWNWNVTDNFFSTRYEIGHLWYLSVDMQAFIAMTALAWILRRRPVGLAFALLGVWSVLAWWRTYVSDREDVLLVLTRTTARMDAFVIGMLAAALVPLLPMLAGRMRGWRIGSGVALVPLAFWCDTNAAFLSLPGTVFQVTAALFLFSLAQSTQVPRRSLLTLPWLVWLGENSLALYIWHMPLYGFLMRHTDGWSWQARSLLAAALLIAICALCHQLIDKRVSRWLAAPGWQRLERGLWPWVSETFRGVWRPSRARDVRSRRSGSGVS